MKLLLGESLISSHQFYALPLAIISSDPRLEPWIYSEFIQWHTFRDREDERMHMRLYNNKSEMFSYEPLHGTIITPKQLVNGNDVISVFRGFLNDGQYIYDFVDHYYIKSLGWNNHFIHDMLIYGYDDDLQVLYAYAYHGGKLTEFDISYHDYETAYNSDYQKNHLHHTILYRKKDEIFRPNISRIGNHLLDYISSVNTYNREVPLTKNLYKSKYGLDVYDELKYNLQYMRDWNLNIDIPDMFCVYDHKRFMIERVNYLDKHTNLKCSDELRNKFAKIEISSKIMLMLVVKLNQKGLSSNTDYNNLMKQFDLLKELENITISEYYEYNRVVFENA